jgi:hypothetical protein
MDWSNRFNFGGFFVTYCTFQIPWEVIEKKGGPRGALQICKNLHDLEIVQNW